MFLSNQKLRLVSAISILLVTVSVLNAQKSITRALISMISEVYTI